MPSESKSSNLSAPADARARLGAIRLLANLTEPERDALGQAVRWRRVVADEEVFAHLSQSDSVCFIAEGSFALSMTTPFGRSVSIRRLQAGDHFGEIAALIATPRSVAVTAETAGLLAECPGAAFRAAMAANGDFASAVASGLARTVVSLTDKLFEVAALEIRFRLYAELLRMARDGQATAGGVRIAEAPTHEAIAAAIGTKRESVTRELNQLASEGVIAQVRRELLIKNLTRLEDMVRARAGPTLSQHLDWQV